MEDKTVWGYLFLTDKELAEKINMSTRTIKKHIKALIAKGYAEEIELADGSIVTRYNLTKLGLG